MMGTAIEGGRRAANARRDHVYAAPTRPTSVLFSRPPTSCRGTFPRHWVMRRAFGGSPRIPLPPHHEPPSRPRPAVAVVAPVPGDRVPAQPAAEVGAGAVT